MHQGTRFAAALCGFAMLFAGQAAWAQSTGAAADTAVGFSVSSFGAATYRIPIQVPPGVGNMTPKLELVYNSQNGDGILGIGWALTGVPAVTRCPSTKATDGVMKAVKLDAGDNYCLGNSRLVLVTAGSSEVEFRRELDDFSSIKLANNVFTEKTKSGVTWEYGGTEDSRIEAQGKTVVREWAVNAIRDVRGNYQAFKYTEDSANGQYQLDQISYGGRAQAPLASVRFEYESRADVTTRWLSGSFSKTTKRISKIKTYVGNSLVREYKIAYAAQPTSLDRTKMVSVTECEATGKCLRPVVVEWSGGSPALAAWQAIPGDLTTNNNDGCSMTRVLDMNGDGAPDIVCTHTPGFGENTVFIRMNEGGGFSSGRTYSPVGGVGNFRTDECAFFDFEDINADSLPDLVCVQSHWAGNQAATYVQINDGSKLTGWRIYSPRGLPYQPGSSQGCRKIQVVDVNGDGLPDIVCVYSNFISKTRTAVQLNTGTALGGWVQYSLDDGKPNLPTAQCMYSTLIDINGDGLPDVVCAVIGAGYVSTTYVQLNTGSGFSDWSVHSDGSVLDLRQCAKMSAVDVNRDRLPDIVCVYGGGDGVLTPFGAGNAGTFVQLNNGVKLLDWRRWDSDIDGVAFMLGRSCDLLELADMNGDMLPDIVCVGYKLASVNDYGEIDKDHGIHIKLNNGNSFVAWQKSYVPTVTGPFATAPFTMHVSDLNSDGLSDLLAFTLSTQPLGFALRAKFSTGQVPVATPPNLVVAVRNGVLRRQVEYKPLSSSAVYVPESGQNKAIFPKMDYVPPAFVVSKVHELSGVGSSSDHQRMWTYTYGGLKAELGSGRGILGFRWMRTVDHAADLETYTEFSQDFPYIGYPMLTELSGNRLASVRVGLLKRTKYKNVACINPANGTACTVSPGKRYFPYVAEIQEDSWDTKFNELTSLNTSYSYVSDVGGQFFGDVGSVIVRYGDGSTSTTTNEYHPANTSSWILGRVKKTVIQNYKP